MSSRWGRRLQGGFGPAGTLTVCLLLAAGGPAHADETEQRLYAVAVDGRPAGQCRMVISSRSDGALVMTADVTVRVKFLFTYSYAYQGTEVWKDGQLASLRSHCDDNGKRFDVSAAAEGGGLHVRVNGKKRPVSPADAWTSSFWKLPDRAGATTQRLTVLDVDRGQELVRRLDYLGAEDLDIAGRAQKCYHFRATGGPSAVDLWFDAQRRLVRQDFVEAGHHTVARLTEVRR